jgi:hypothetical protein
VAGGFDHGRTRFPLEGRHVDVQCAKCHGDETKTAGMAFDTCARCHADVHAGQFTASARGGACERCHDVNGFVPARFTATDHGRTRFALDGAHLAQPCVACHSEETLSGQTTRRFAFADMSCSACHDDAHAGQFTAAPPVKRCEQCHRTASWRDLAFDHDRDTSYRLEGAHGRAACGGCHTAADIAGRTVARYRGVATACVSCHIDQPVQLGGSP